MRLTKAEIHTFSSFNDPPPVELNQQISLILGKNESGKTSFLKAIASFEEGYKYQTQELCSYSESRKEADKKKTAHDNLKIITLTFSLEPVDIPYFKEIHDSLSEVREFTVTKFFSGRRLLAGQEYQKATKALDSEISAHIGRMKNDFVSLAAMYMQAGNPGAIAPILEGLVKSLETPKQDQIATSLSSAQVTLRTTTTEGVELEEKKRAADEQITKLIDLLTKKTQRPQKVFDRLPHILYFRNVDQLEDQVTLSELSSSPDEYKTLRNLLDLVGVDPTALASADLYERRRLTRNASTFVTGLVNDSWKQEQVQVNISVDGDNLVVSVEDGTGAIDPPSRRSEGFQYFLAFYVNFTVGSRGALKNTVILLDDPGVYLHADGQRNLLSTLEKLSASNQIVLATHSPFLVDPHRLERILIAEKKPDKIGSSLSRDFHKSAFDSLQAVRAAVGMTLGNSLFFNKTNILLEGPSDVWILEGFAKSCAARGLTEFSLSRVALVGVGGAEKMPYFVHLISAEGLPFACLLDHDNEGRRTLRELVDEIGVRPESVLTLAVVTGQGADSELEDLIDMELYLRAVNQTYASVSSPERQFPAVEVAFLDEYDGLRTKKLQRFFRDRGLGDFDKEAVAREIYNLTTAADFNFEDYPAARVNFPNLFARLGGTIGT